MATTISALLPIVRNHLVEITPKFWTDAELATLTITGIRDLWRDIVDLKQEHYLTHDITNVTLPANSISLSGVPTDVHKVYLIEPRDLTDSGANRGLSFKPLEYNHPDFQGARSCSPIDPTNGIIYYAITQQGAPVGAPVILTAPQVNSTVLLSFNYVPSLGTLLSSSTVPIPGEADNALIAWTVAFARAKEREDRSPDPAWLTIYSTEKAHLLESLGLRQYQENSYVEALFGGYW